MNFKSLVENVKIEENKLQQAKEDERQNLIKKIQYSISLNAEDKYHYWAELLAKAITHEKKSTIRVQFPERIPILPDEEYQHKGYTDLIKDLDLILDDPREGYHEMEFATNLRIILVHKGEEYKLTTHYYSFLDQIRKLANSDNILVSDIICVEHTFIGGYNGSRDHKYKDVPLNKANDFKRSRFNSQRGYFYDLYLELSYKG